MRFDTAFAKVIEGCARSKRPGQRGTWITDELMAGYLKLFERGFAHSAEAYLDGVLVGGLYGVGLGKMFFGESMFASAPDASKCAFTVLVAHLVHWGFSMVDCQVHTEHLERFGAIDWPRSRFLPALRKAVASETRRGPWQIELDREQVLAIARE